MSASVIAIPYEVFLMISERLPSIQDLIFLSQTCRQLRYWSRSCGVRLPATFPKSWARRVLKPHPQLLFAHYATEFGEAYLSNMTLDASNSTVTPRDRRSIQSGRIFGRGLTEPLNLCVRNFQGVTITDIETLRRRRDDLQSMIEEGTSPITPCKHCSRGTIHDFQATMINYINLRCIHHAFPFEEIRSPKSRCSSLTRFVQFHNQCDKYLDNCIVPESQHTLECNHQLFNEALLIALRDLTALWDEFLEATPTAAFHIVSPFVPEFIRRKDIDKINFVVGFKNLSRMPLETKFAIDIITGERREPCRRIDHRKSGRCLDCDHHVPIEHAVYKRRREFYALLGAWFREDRRKWSVPAAMECFGLKDDHLMKVFQRYPAKWAMDHRLAELHGKQ